MRHGLEQARATVIWGEPRAALSELMRTWNPDLVVCDSRTQRMLPARPIEGGPELMRVDRDGALSRLAGFFFSQAHA